MCLFSRFFYIYLAPPHVSLVRLVIKFLCLNMRAVCSSFLWDLVKIRWDPSESKKIAVEWLDHGWIRYTIRVVLPSLSLYVKLFMSCLFALRIDCAGTVQP